jgi:hypothetical protein
MTSDEYITVLEHEQERQEEVVRGNGRERSTLRLPKIERMKKKYIRHR